MMRRWHEAPTANRGPKDHGIVQNDNVRPKEVDVRDATAREGALE